MKSARTLIALVMACALGTMFFMGFRRASSVPVMLRAGGLSAASLASVPSNANPQHVATVLRSDTAAPNVKVKELVNNNASTHRAVSGPVSKQALLPTKPPSSLSKIVKPSVLLGHIGPLEPAIATAGPHKGQPCKACVFVAVTTCCATWSVTSILLQQLLKSNDNIHVAVFDDMSTDALVANVKALGLTVITPPRGVSVGLTMMMNHAWQYYYDRPELDVMYIMNNDLEMSPINTFSKLARCMHSIEGPGVVGPMTNAIGLGTGFHHAAYLSWQNAEHSRHRPLYQDKKMPRELPEGLPSSIVAYNQWLEDTLAYRNGNVTAHVRGVLGFMMGFKRDHPMHNVETGQFIAGGRNSHQEYYMFEVRKIKAYVCHDTFIYHDKTSVTNPITKAAMELNMRQGNKPGQHLNRQS